MKVERSQDPPQIPHQRQSSLICVALIWGSALVPQIHGMAHVGPMTFAGVRFLIGRPITVAGR
jgi:hypothetical protein